MTTQNLEIQLREEDVAGPVVKFLRMLTSYEMRTAHLRMISGGANYADIVWSLHGSGRDNASRTEKERNLDDYCIQRVENDSWADHVEIVALGKSLGVEIEIVSIGNNTDFSRSLLNDIPGRSRALRASLLFRDLHYEVLCPERQYWAEEHRSPTLRLQGTKPGEAS